LFQATALANNAQLTEQDGSWSIQEIRQGGTGSPQAPVSIAAIQARFRAC
jgi:hypothetical protein